MTLKAKPQTPVSAILYTPQGGDQFDWYVIETAPSCAELAARELAAAGLTVFVPFKVVWRRVGRGKVVKTAPIKHPAFFNYIFASFGAKPDNWPALASVRYVASVVGTGGKPHLIGPRQMAAIAERAERGDFNPGRENKPAKGDKVRVSVGALRGIDLEVADADDEKASLVIEMIGVKSLIKINLDDLIASA